MMGKDLLEGHIKSFVVYIGSLNEASLQQAKESLIRPRSDFVRNSRMTMNLQHSREMRVR